MNDMQIYRVELNGQASSLAWEGGTMFYVWRDGDDPEVSNFNTRQAAEQRIFMLPKDGPDVPEGEPVITAYRLSVIEQVEVAA